MSEFNTYPAVDADLNFPEPLRRAIAQYPEVLAKMTKVQVGLGNADNTSDANKPISTKTQTALNLKAPLASPAFTGTPTGLTKAHVGLANVDNTTDANKPLSTAAAKLPKGRIANTEILSPGLTFSNTWLVAAAMNSVPLVAGRNYMVRFTSKTLIWTEAELAVGVTLRKSATNVNTVVGTDVGMEHTLYMAPKSGQGKTITCYFEWTQATTETVNLKLCIVRATGTVNLELQGRAITLIDEGAA